MGSFSIEMPTGTLWILGIKPSTSWLGFEHPKQKTLPSLHGAHVGYRTQELHNVFIHMLAVWQWTEWMSSWSDVGCCDPLWHQHNSLQCLWIKDTPCSWFELAVFTQDEVNIATKGYQSHVLKNSKINRYKHKCTRLRYPRCLSELTFTFSPAALFVLSW